MFHLSAVPEIGLGIELQLLCNVQDQKPFVIYVCETNLRNITIAECTKCVINVISALLR